MQFVENLQDSMVQLKKKGGKNDKTYARRFARKKRT